LDVLDPETGKAYRPTSRGGWGIISNELKEKQVRFVAPQEVAFAREKGLAIIDVRPAKEYQSGHIEGSVNVQYYRWIEGWNLWKFARRFMFTFFGVVGTEPNPEFVHEIMEVADPRKGVVLACNLGGHLEEYGPSPHGYQTRSLMAAYELFLNGYEDVRVVKGGIGEWRRQERTLVEEK
jgi:rhodanese-related sulfurtransferase